MSGPQPDPSQLHRLTDDELIHTHERVATDRTDDRGVYKLLPLLMLLVFSGLIFFSATYVGHFSGHFAPTVFDERASPHTGAIAPAAVDPVILGKQKYDSLCVNCHQSTGQGLPNVFPPLAGSDWVEGPEDRVIRILLDGLSGPITVSGKEFGNGPGAVPMPAIGPGGMAWSDSDIAAVLTYIRQEWGNNAPAISAEKVTEIRNQVGKRDPWTAAELESIQ